MRFTLLLLVLVFGLKSFAQADSVMVSDNRADAIYLTYDDFRRNNFISKAQIVAKLDTDQLEFIGKVLDPDQFSYKSNGSVASAESRKIWGFYQNKTLYVNFKGDFYRVPVFGAISYLVATVIVTNSGYYDPMFGYGLNSTRTKEIREFMINFYDGIMIEFSLAKAEELLSRDPVLFAEYKKLGRRKQKEQVNRYIRKYNELHPVYFLK